jgi:hypothetical protein
VSCEFISGGLVVVAVKPKANISRGSNASALHSTDYLPLMNVIFLADVGEYFSVLYRGADKSLGLPGRKQVTATETFDFHISYL